MGPPRSDATSTDAVAPDTGWRQHGTTPDIHIAATDDPRDVLRRAEDQLARDPIADSFLIGLLHQRATKGVPGRYWVASERDGVPAGVVVQIPPGGLARLTTMPRAVVQRAADSIPAEGVPVGGVAGPPDAATAFAAQCADTTKSPVVPTMGERLYEVVDVHAPRRVPGSMRPATTGDMPLLLEWTRAFGIGTAQGFGAASTADRTSAAPVDIASPCESGPMRVRCSR